MPSLSDTEGATPVRPTPFTAAPTRNGSPSMKQTNVPRRQSRHDSTTSSRRYSNASQATESVSPAVSWPIVLAIVPTLGAFVAGSAEVWSDLIMVLLILYYTYKWVTGASLIELFLILGVYYNTDSVVTLCGTSPMELL